MFSRSKAIENFKQKTFDLVVVGGGITGAGVARDAASRGMSVALIDQQDFSAGTSSRSSKLIHGGIRYLENFEFGLVFEALRERRLLFDIAPHLVHPLKFVLPLYRSGRVRPFIMSLGMWLYDALALFDAPELHQKLNVDEVKEVVPWLNQSDLLCAYSYYDAYMDDDRLVHETMRSAFSYGAQCANYVSALGANFENGKITSINARDEISKQEFVIRGRHFVSAVGPWTDLLNQKIDHQWKNRMRPTKGIHLTFSRERFPLEDAVVMALEKEDRVIFAIPREEMVIVGTTDTDFKGDPSTVKTETRDVDYLLKIANDYFPLAKLTVADVIASYSGVRPLIADGSESESKVSREHVIFTTDEGLTVVSGGKYTTYRHMAEQTVKKVLRFFPVDKKIQFGRTKTTEPLNPLASPERMAKANSNIEAWSQETHIPQDLVKRAISRHGYEALEILTRMTRWKVSTSDLEAAYWMAEADFAIDHTQCLNLTDFYLRRTPLFLAKKNHGFFMFEALAKVFTEKLGQTDFSVEKTKLKTHLHHEMGWVDNADSHFMS